MLPTDPDAPSRANPVRREFRHWLVGNIPGDKVDQGDTLTEYVGSGPPKDTGKIQKFRLQHRFASFRCQMGSCLIAAQRIKVCWKEKAHIQTRLSHLQSNLLLVPGCQIY
jgi:hypothetical protein